MRCPHVAPLFEQANMEVLQRMFMEMKREVRRLGGYAREYFVSQTPELTAMADKVINLDELVGEGEAMP